MPAATDKLQGIQQPSAVDSGFRLANTLIISVPTRAQPGSRLGSLLRTTCARQWRTSCLPGRDQRVSDARTRRPGRGIHVPAPVPTRCCPPAGKRTAPLLSVHKHVDDLCATAPSLCTDGGNAGDSAAQPEPGAGIYLGERESRLCIKRNQELSTAHAVKMVNEPNVYRRFIRL
jgi:hypothetical protein